MPVVHQLPRPDLFWLPLTKRLAAGTASTDTQSDQPYTVPRDRFLVVRNIFAHTSAVAGGALTTTMLFALHKGQGVPSASISIVAGWSSNFDSRMVNLIFNPGELLYIRWAGLDTTQAIDVFATLSGQLYQVER